MSPRAHVLDAGTKVPRPCTAPPGRAWRLAAPLVALGLASVATGCGAPKATGAPPDLPTLREPPPSLGESAAEPPDEAVPPEDDVPPIDFPSCDQARSSYVESYDLSARGQGPPDVPLSEYQAVLGRGTYLEPCGVPRSAAVTVCAAVIQGKAVGASVTLAPHNQRIINCVIQAVEGLSFPSNPRLDIATSRFEPGG
jgi:hypothetical protein